MREKTIEHLHAVFRAHHELAELLPEEAFGQKLPVPSNTIGAQFYCIVGARESYARALKENGWVGFICSLPPENASRKKEIVLALAKTGEDLERLFVEIEWTTERDDLLLDLLEHEALHQGQLIRYVYGLRHTFPKSWIERWALDE